MTARLLATTLLGAALAFSAGAFAATPGSPAPGFTETDTAGKSWSLGDFAGRTVVLEWTNHDCPYVKKHYSAGNMQGLQGSAAENGIVWLTVISSAPGKQGHVSAAEADQLSATRGATPAAVLLDEDGSMGRAYGAKTTPHMYVIDGAGTLVYAGAIDDKPTANPADIPGATNYVTAALTSLAAGEPVAVAETQAYGCSVKY